MKQVALLNNKTSIEIDDMIKSVSEREGK